MKSVVFEGSAYEQFVEWAESDFDIFLKIDRLLRDISRDPFKGLGKPEPLKYTYKRYWSRRITSEHLLIYKFEQQTIFVTSLKGHYND